VRLSIRSRLHAARPGGAPSGGPRGHDGDVKGGNGLLHHGGTPGIV
jgi:hypothetical protein